VSGPRPAELKTRRERDQSSLILGVRLDQAGQIVEMRPGNELPRGYTGEGWLESWRDLRYGVCEEPHTFIHRPR
jgi:hypothetical protein